VVLFSGWAHGVQPGDVEGDGGEGEFVCDLIQPTGAKLADTALLFEDSEDRFDDGLASRVGGLSGRRSRLNCAYALIRELYTQLYVAYSFLVAYKII
jgi:hypothetical protein